MKIKEINIAFVDKYQDKVYVIKTINNLKAFQYILNKNKETNEINSDDGVWIEIHTVDLETQSLTLEFDDDMEFKNVNEKENKEAMEVIIKEFDEINQEKEEWIDQFGLNMETQDLIYINDWHKITGMALTNSPFGNGFYWCQS